MPLPDKVVKGTISLVREKYVLRYEGRSVEIPPQLAVSEPEIKKLVDKEVAVAIAPGRSGSVIAIGIWAKPDLPRFRCVLCYLPAPDFITRVRPAVQEAMVRQLVKEGIMSPALGKELTGKQFSAGLR